MNHIDYQMLSVIRLSKKTKNIQQMMNTIVSCLISDQLFAKYQVFINKQTSRGVQRQRRHCF